MPLQKSHPQVAAPPGQPPTDGRQLQGRRRRRSLHTISELCAIDGATPESNPFMAEKSRIQRNRTHHSVTNEQDLSKKRSLPPYYPYPNDFQAPMPVSRQPLDVSTAMNCQPTQVSYEQCGSVQQQQGWNARRDMARIQREEAVSRAAYHRQTLSSVAPNYSYATIPRKPVQSHYRPELRSYSSHQQLLSNSRSISGFSQTLSAPMPARRASMAVMSNEVSEARAFETEAYEKASTDSSSYKSFHDSTVRRSRSGSSSDTSYSPLPLTICSPPPVQRYYSMPARYRGSSLGPGQPTIAPPPPRHVSVTRTSSLPTIHAERGEPWGPSKRHPISRSPQSPHERDVERARLDSLAALTSTHATPPQDQRYTSSLRHSDRDALPSQQAHHRITSYNTRSHAYSQPHPGPPQYTSLASSSPSSSSSPPPPPPPPPLLLPANPDTTSTFVSQSLLAAHGFPFVEKRSVPRRESLTQWKAERHEACLHFDAGWRARIRERVRRANELEVEKEMELVRLGRGTGVGGGLDHREGGLNIRQSLVHAGHEMHDLMHYLADTTRSSKGDLFRRADVGRVACRRAETKLSYCAMPATGGGRAVRAPPTKMQQQHPPPPLRRESSAAPVSTQQRRPGIKTRAYSAPSVPKSDSEASNHRTDDDDHNHEGEGEGEEIADDAFFQRYHFPQPMPTAQEEGEAGSSAESSSDTEGPLSPTFIKDRQAAGDASEPSTGSANSDSPSSMHDLNIAVIGARGSGKSTFVRRALGLPDAPATGCCSRRMTIDGSAYVVRLLEMTFNDVHVGDRSSIKWPETVHDFATPRIHAAITLYDVANHESLANVPEMLNTFNKAHLPFILVACKCDQHPAHREVDPAVVEQKAKSFIGDVSVFQTSESSPETHRACLSVITRAAIAAKRPRSQASIARRRANSSAVKSISQKDLWGRKHERASSEISMRFQRGTSEVKGHRYKPSDVNKTFFNAEESPGYDSQDSDDQDSDAGQSIMSVKPSDENGYTFEQLVDRLLAQPMSKNDAKFVSVFLALYRRFATPGQLLEAIIKRFESFDKDKDLPMIRIISQLRYLAILQQWVSYYPGDFAYPTTRRLVRRFASSLASNREFSVAASEILRDLDMVTEDDDTEWACSDRQRAQSENIPTFHNNVLDEDSDEDEFSRALGHMSTTESARNSLARSSMTGGASSTNGSVGSSQLLLTQAEKNERLARQLEPNPVKPLSKIQWHQLMNEPDDAIARELTRIDWIMFSSVRPRDLVRHVSLNSEEKKKCKNLENVTRMTEHFNHVAYLVTNYILLRDKPKHRALMMEKWMKIARQLRKLNNYNMLGAVMAGIKGTAVIRLHATKDLVPQTTTQDFWKLDILMSQTRSHAAYRLAWENSSGERIPYIPLHRRDLVSASEGNSTFVGDKKKTDSALLPHPGVSVFEAAAGKRDGREPPPGGVVGKERINWRKFEIMGEVIVGVQRAQGTPYPSWQKCEEIRNLILDVKINKDDEDLWERSAHLEAQGANEKGRIARWFRER
ncbi:rap guanine nucleotide exchange factor 4 [Stemphylium lycopersici]|uniref:Rap guanine nucleotide exchange factor 4 n=1 Tax=Stemphylium lycopersici TaxID=183478 RepID=A0A364NGC0_STELY|nr:rap guanine nucleotide exchange factor 4 [Stemphylium lycopersici]RAR16306.1 rap guanine nucleotide exchange factor 4 [Stemphylium lycopersici]